jgi:lipopolysaccharide/colanic/teichoic acid biosynthesis glycosyltransferase
MLKRFFDFIFALIGLVILSPLVLIIVILIKLNDHGPSLYKGARAGFKGKPFKMLKFRTMVMNADKIGGPSTSGDDPRITRIGKFLRKYKLDELPQLLNVLRGEMSFVGPRPEVLSEVETYSDEQKQVLTVRPGITDFASLHFPNEGEILKGAPDPHEAYRRLIKPKKIALQLKYVNKRNLLIDLMLVLKTIKTILRCRKV